jgi:hypothetical protein
MLKITLYNFLGVSFVSLMFRLFVSLYLKKNRADGMAQEVKHLPSKSEVLSSTFSTTKEKRKHSCLTFLKHVLKYDFCEKAVVFFLRGFTVESVLLFDLGRD